MGTKNGGGLLVMATKEAEIEVAGEKAFTTIQVPVRIKNICGECGKPMDFAIDGDPASGLTITSYCRNCMFREEADNVE